MLKSATRIGVTFAFVLAGLGFLLAQGNDSTRKSGTSSALYAKSLLGAKVHIQGDTGVGIVEDFVLSDEGVVDYLIVSDSGKLFTVPWDAAKFNFEKRIATINITQEQYRQIPTYTADRYPQFYTPVYRTEVYRYYGIKPGPIRRLMDRR